MIATGTVSIDGETFEVSGVAWFDREFGVLGRLAKQSREWFAIELDDGRQIMVADINPSGPRTASSTRDISQGRWPCLLITTTSIALAAAQIWRHPTVDR